MSNDPFDDLPDQFKNAIKDMIERLQSIDPEQLEEMMNQMLGKDFMEKMKDLSFTGGTFAFPLDPNMAKNFEVIMKKLMDDQPTFEDQNFKVDEEPYYEITPPVEGKGEIVVELQGITDVRQVKWKRDEDILEVIAEADDLTYSVSIALRPTMTIKDVFAEVKNAVFILPYTE